MSIKKISFALHSGDDIEKMSALEVTNRKLYADPPSARVPERGGVLDPRMGISNKKVGGRSTTCQTCRKDLDSCVGHFGFVRLALPVYHVGYIKHVVRVLQCVCKKCSKFLLPEAEREHALRLMRGCTFSFKESSDQEAKDFEAVVRTIVTRCRRMSTCERCSAPNGWYEAFCERTES